MPRSRISVVSCSPSLIAAEEYAPARPRSLVRIRTAARSSSRAESVRGCLVLGERWEATTDSARTSSRV